MLLILILNNHNDYECSNLFNLDQKKSCTFDSNVKVNGLKNHIMGHMWFQYQYLVQKMIF